MELEIWSKSFGNQPVLGNIRLTVDKGEIIALTGPSGIGKSTLVRIVAGLDRHFEGVVQDVGCVGFVFQEPTLLPWRNLLDNITITTGCSAYTAATALEQVELRNRTYTYPNHLSLGQQRRVALARALAAKPQTLILDEAFASLDEATAERMRRLTRKILAGNSFSTIMVTHNIEEAVEMADRILVLNGSPATIQLDHHIAAPSETRDCASEVAKLRSKLGALPT